MPFAFAPSLVSSCADFRITNERPEHFGAREHLLDAAFGPGRFSKACEGLREGRLPAAGLALAAVNGERLVGTLRLWPIEAGNAGTALLLGPLAVAEDCRNEGLGGKLMCEGLRHAGLFGHRAVILVGDEPYYRRFGFSTAKTQRLIFPGAVDPARTMALELIPGALNNAAGQVVPGRNESIWHQAA